MRSIRSLSLALAVAVGLGALSGCAAPAGDRPLIVVTTNILGDVVGNIVGDQAEVLTLMRPNSDPHSFEISAQEAARILRADLVVSNGLGLEEGLQQQLDTADTAGVAMLAAGTVIDPLPYASGTGSDTADPHFWTDPARMVEVVEAVTAAVRTDVAGVDAALIEAQAAAYTTELQALDAEMTTAFAAIGSERRNLVTNHHVFGYLADRFDFTVVGAVIPGGSTLAAPSASDLRSLVDAIDTAGVATIFAESSQPDRLVQVLADEAGLNVAVVELFTESLSEPGAGADSYLTMMRTNTERITTGLSP
ncbi:zinc ABC transporter substrate-binding protein AztC [Cryobacterium sp. TMB1-7]|uniref:zinc ABC transporter substrate-binding protein AztC n=1 Tax=Cryobacterium sp. TMB1-7 TaxID=2555866 RepID=UPI00106B1FF2|nr:zinc ABC transporter substrate-binding protein AztC [Cryobacterium sp. TMB1-7]TFC58204.1 zinc ABC transporter substrate-binding protein [Cryobacterium sp. TMB1-7]